MERVVPHRRFRDSSILVFLSVVYLVTLSGCGIFLYAYRTPPERLDPFEGLGMVQTTQKVPPGELDFRLATMENLTLGLILSQNTKNMTSYGEKYCKELGEKFVYCQLVKFLSELPEVFDRNFKRVVAIEQLKDAKASGVDIVAIWDVSSVTHGGFCAAQVIFLTVDGRLIDDLRLATQNPFIPQGSVMCGNRETWIETKHQLEGKLFELFEKLRVQASLTGHRRVS